MSHLYDSWSNEYKTPFGAIERGSECKFTIKFPDDTMIEEPVLVMFRPGFKERFIKLENIGSSDGFTGYSCVYSPNDTGLHHYYFLQRNQSPKMV